MAAVLKFTPETQARIIRYVKGGVYLETAAASAGIGKSTLHEWLRRGREEKSGKYREFADEVEAAVADDEARTVMRHEALSGETVSKRVTCRCGEQLTVKVPVPGNVQLHALQWKMSRKFQSRYGNLLKIEHKVQAELQGMLAAVRPRMSPGAYDELVTALESEMGVEGLAEGTAEESAGEPEGSPVP